MSLKCPLSFIRLRTPCRGMACNHNQCFDATSYLQLQEQAPTWICPVCNKSATWESLVLDHYVQNILDSTSPDTEQVTLEPDGTWSAQKEEPNNSSHRNSNPTPSDDEDDDDLVEIPGMRLSFNRNPFQPLTPSSVPTPPQSSVQKRAREEVIDLTLSDDDDDQHAQPPSKRPTLSSGS
jgi:E3 SUMO-protein ligase PIAS1